MHGFIEPFYRDVEKEEREFAPGHIYNDQPVYLPARHALRIDRVDRHDDSNLDFRVVGRTDDTFNHPPVHSLQLESSEAAVLTKTKKDRPVVVLGGTHAAEPLAGPDRAQHVETATCVPIYGADQHSAGMRKRMRAYEFPNVFYLPKSDCKAPFDEGFARLDQAQPIPKQHLRRHRALALTDDALQALWDWYVYFVTEQIEPDSLLMEYRRTELAALAD